MMKEEKWVKDYKQFMHNPDNEYNCEVCPENKHKENQQWLPCGQQNCWVTCHCKGR